MQRALGADRFGAGQFGQPLHPRLRLLGLAGLGFEAVDEGLQVGAFGLFFQVGDLLQPQMFGALTLKIGVIARIQLRGAIVQMQNVGGHVVEKLAVVRNHQQRAGIALEPFFQPHHGIQVQVVGGLVE